MCELFARSLPDVSVLGFVAKVGSRGAPARNAAIQVHFAVNHLGILIVHQPCSSILDGTRDGVYRILQICY